METTKPAAEVSGPQIGNSTAAGGAWQDVRANLLYQIGSKVGAVSDLSELVQQIVLMTQRTLKAAASSVLLLDESTQELVFEVVEGEAGDKLKQVRISTQSGIAGWVARNS